MSNSKSKPFVCWPVSLQVPGRPITLDPSRTALAAAAYIRRDRYEMDDPDFVDFTKRGNDLVARIPILRANAPEWMKSSYLRWKLADEASNRTGKPEDIRAWHIVADLPPEMSAGQWIDGATEVVSKALAGVSVADLAIHNPEDGAPHAHLIVASRLPGEHGYGAVDYDLHFSLNVVLRRRWADWIEEWVNSANC